MARGEARSYDADGFPKGSTQLTHFNSLSRPESFSVIVINGDKGNDFVED
jgi:hypothetical protein